MADDRVTRMTQVRTWLGANRHRGVLLSTVAVVLAVVVGGIAVAATGGLNSAPRETANAPVQQGNGSPQGPLTSSSSVSPGQASSTSTAPTTPTSSQPVTTETTTANNAQTTPSSTPGTTAAAAVPTPTVTPTTAPSATTSTTVDTTTSTTQRFDRAFTVTAEDESSSLLPTDPGVAVGVTASDNGGFITRISVNWAVGEQPEYANYEISSCVNSPSGRPTTARDTRFTHVYDTPGTYNVVVQATSTDCSGNNSRSAYSMVSVTSTGTTSTTA